VLVVDPVDGPSGSKGAEGAEASFWTEYEHPQTFCLTHRPQIVDEDLREGHAWKHNRCLQKIWCANRRGIVALETADGPKPGSRAIPPTVLLTRNRRSTITEASSARPKIRLGDPPHLI